MPAGCGDMPAGCGDMPAGCGDMPAGCGDMPAACRDMPVACREMPGGCFPPHLPVWRSPSRPHENGVGSRPDCVCPNAGAHFRWAVAPAREWGRLPARLRVPERRCPLQVDDFIAGAPWNTLCDM